MRLDVLQVRRRQNGNNSLTRWAAAPAADAPDYGRHLNSVTFDIQRRDGAQGWGSRVLSDIDMHVPTNFGNTYKDSDPITWAHESTHGINSAVRNRYGPGYNAFYIGDGRAVVLPEPNIRKSSVDQFIPPACAPAAPRCTCAGNMLETSSPSTSSTR